MKTTRRSHQLLATVAAASLILAACGGDDDDATGGDTASAEDSGTASAEETGDAGTAEATGTEETGTAEATGTEETGTGDATPVAYGNAQEFSNYNNNLASSNSVKNGIVVNEVLPDTFYFAGPTGDLVMDEELLDAVNVISEDPQVIEFVVNADAAWSDGDPIDCDDFYMYWSVNSGKYVELDDNGEPVIDPETEAEVPLFQTTGTTGFDVIDSIDCSDDGKTITVNYSDIFADWRASFTNMTPAHVVAREAGVEDSIAAFQNDDRAAIEAMAEFFNNGWSMNPGELLPAELIPSGDKMMIDSWEAGSSLTLVPNPNYWGTPANGPVVIRYIAEEAQAQALANGEINAMDPQPTPDLLAQLDSTEGVTVETGSQFIWEHFDFNFNNEALANPLVREAFANCLPRQQMVTNLIQPLDPTATILNNRFNQQFEAGYVENNDGRFQEVDLEAAQALLDESGVAQPVDIRLGWFDNGGNARRTDQVALTIESCNQVGFNVIDNGSETFFDVELAASDWDVAMFAWAGSPLKTGSSETYRCEGGINFGGYCNPEVDALLDAINQELDAQTQVDLSNQVDQLLWDDLVTIPVFSFPGVVAYSDNAQNVIYNPSQNGLTWNASAWQLS